MTYALNNVKVKTEFLNADISIFSILKRKSKVSNFTQCNLASHSKICIWKRYAQKIKDYLSSTRHWFNPFKTRFDKNDLFDEYVNPEEAKQLVSHIKNFISIDRLVNMKHPVVKRDLDAQLLHKETTT